MKYKEFKEELDIYLQQTELEDGNNKPKVILYPGELASVLDISYSSALRFLRKMTEDGLLRETRNAQTFRICFIRAS